MSLTNHFNKTLELLLDRSALNLITAEQLIHSIDLTLLDESALTEQISQLKQDANQHQVAAVCVYSQHLPQFDKANVIDLATVINFPQGQEKLNVSCAAIEKAIRLGVAEIDYVLPYSLYLEGNKQQAIQQCKAIIQLCKQEKLRTKIILETGLFPDMEMIYTLSKELIELGCDFIKTSTGKIPQGASLSAAFAILSALKEIPNKSGIKLSGGVKKTHQALQYAQLAEIIMGKPINKNWFRIGASSLLEELLLM